MIRRAAALICVWAVVLAGAAAAAPAANGTVVYSNNTTAPQARRYTATSNSFAAAAAMPAGAAQAWMVDRAAPTRTEHLAGYVTSANPSVLYVLRWDGTAWASEWSVTVGGDGVNGRRFDIAYEQSTGDAVVVYSNNTAGADELRYQVWNGSSWSGALNLDSARLTGTPNGIKLAPRPGGDQIAATIADTNNDLTTLIWSGAAWGNEPAAAHTAALYRVANPGDVDIFDAAYSSANGDLFVAYTDQTPQQYYRRYTQAGGWQAASTFGAAGYTAYAMFASADPDPASNRILFGFNRSGAANVLARVWNGSAMSAVGGAGTNGAAPAINQRTLTGGWVASGATRAAVVAYAGTTNSRLDWGYTTNDGTNWSSNQSVPLSGTSPGTKRWMDASMDPRGADTLMLTFSDSNGALWAKRLVFTAPTLAWTNADGGNSLGALGANTTQNFDFAYDVAVTATIAGTVTATQNGTGISVTAPFTGDIDGDGSATAAYRVSPSGGWSSAAAMTRGTGQFTAAIPGLTCGSSYDVQVIYSDADGVSGTATQTVTGVPLDQCTVAGALTAAPSCTSIAVIAAFAQDSNANNTGRIEYRPSGGAWMAWTPVTRAAGQFTATITGLDQNASYDLRFTFGDPDGVSGTSQPTATVMTTNTCAIAGSVTLSPGCTTMGVVATYSGDTNANVSATAAYRVSPSGAWSSESPMSRGSGQFTSTLTGLAGTTAYDVRVTWSDADGVTGTNPGTAAATTSCIATIAGSVAATRSTCTAIHVTASYTGDSNANDTLLVEYRQPGYVWSPWQTLAHAASYATEITGLSQGLDYEVRVTFQDEDGVSGTNPAAVTGLYACSTRPEPVSTSYLCNSISVVAPYTGDSDANNGCTVEYKRSVDGAWTLGADLAHFASPYSSTLGGLTPATSYDVRVTFNDATGVTALNPQTVMIALPACGNQLSLTNPGQPASGAVAAGTPGFVLGRIGLSASAGTITVTGLRVANSGAGTGMAPDSDLQALQLYDDANGNGAIDAGDSLLANGRWDAALSRWVFSPLSHAVSSPSARQLILSMNASSGAATGHTFVMALDEGDVTVSPFNQVAASSVSGSSFSIAAGPTEGSTGTSAPMALILNPGNGAVVSGSFRVQVQVHNPGGLAALSSVSLSKDNGADGYALYTFNLGADLKPQYAAGSNAAVYETTLNLTPGAYTLRAQASNTVPAMATSRPAVISVVAAGKGDGNLLVRDNSSELCADCHAIATHSSQTTSTRYGSWGFTCRDCHQPHGTPNIFLLNKAITPPAVSSYSAAKAVRFSATTGATTSTAIADASFANEADNSGPCQVCHTRTQNPTTLAARWRNTGNADPHYTTAAGTRRCTSCHSHNSGFAGGESKGGASCSGCHGTTWQGLTGEVAKTSKHTLGSVPDTNDGWTDSGLTWASPLASNAAAARSCTNMCHPDHTHNAPGQTAHDQNVHQDATNAASRTYGRDGSGNISSGTPDRTDFSAAAANGGMCLSCHRFDVDASRPGIGIAPYGASAHDYTSFSTYGAWTYQLHDGSVFDRNCTKCHSDSANTAQAIAGNDLGGPHYSGQPFLLTGTKNPNGVPATFVCYGCHGNDTTGTNLSGKDIASQIAHAATAGQSGHPASSDSVHDSVAESNNAAFGNALGGAGRHSSCLDCHGAHQAKAGTHTAQTNQAGPPLEGAWGASLSTLPSFWAAPVTTHFTKKVIVSGTDPEAILCFKCHSSYYGTLPTAPSGTFTETDTAREFNPNNAGNYLGGASSSWAAGETAGSFHPVLASAGSNLGATSNLKAPWTRTSLMTCSDCHESDLTTDPNGPHGSAAKFILKGPNTAWNSTVATQSAGMPNGTFCINCHNQNFTSTRFSQHTTIGAHMAACFNCHAAIPHGTIRPGLLVAPAGADANVGGAVLTDSAPYAQPPAGSTSRLYLVSYPTNNTTAWARSNCGCNGTSH